MGDIALKPVLLPRTFYEREPDVVARKMLGKILNRQYRGRWLAGRIIETEAYLGELDPASHAHRGKSPFNAVLFGPAGFTDVYMIYGVHYCVNVSCLPDGQPGGILIRALHPTEGVSTMARLRGLSETASSRSLAGGPGRVCQALGITRANDHNLDVTSKSSAIQISDDGYCPGEILVTKRIGISKAVDLPLRFLVGKSDSRHQLRS